VNSRRTDFKLDTGASLVVKGNYPDGGSFRTESLFLQDEVDFSKRLHGVFGVRRDWFQLAARTCQ